MTTILEGYALRRAVAEEQGWRVKAVDESDVGIINPEVRFVVYAPNGIRFMQSQNDLDTTWELVMLYTDTPDYPNDLNTIEDAPLPDNYVMEIIRIGDSRMVRFHNSQSNDESFYALHPTKTATAFWNAWLEMRKAGRDG